MRLVWVLLPFTLCAQTSSDDAARGRALFRGNCAFCHGAAGQGGRGPNLAGGQATHGRTEADLRRVITKGVPGSSMPSFGGMDAKELDKLVAFVKSLSAGDASVEKASGDAAKGRAAYVRLGCAACHRIGEEGSDFGPELTRVGAGRPLAYLRQSIVEPSADIPEEYSGVTVVEKNGTRVSGTRLNEDTFSVQLRDVAQKFRLFDKSEVKEVIADKTSLMPAYKSLPKETLEDVIAYLASLRGPASETGAAKEREGIR